MFTRCRIDFRRSAVLYIAARFYSVLNTLLFIFCDFAIFIAWPYVCESVARVIKRDRCRRARLSPAFTSLLSLRSAKAGTSPGIYGAYCRLSLRGRLLRARGGGVYGGGGRVSSCRSCIFISDPKSNC